MLPRSTLPLLPSLPLPPELPTTVAVQIPDAIDPSRTLSSHVRWLVEARLLRLLTASESEALELALADALSLLQAGGDGYRQQLLNATMGVALLNAGAAALWACCVEALEQLDSGRSVAAFATSLLDTASNMAGAMFASTALGDGT